MGKTLDALFPRRRFRTSKFKATASLAISRLAVLKNQRQARCSIARSDVVEFLKSGSHDRALLRVEQVIKEQNMLDVFVVLEGYLHLLIERVSLFEQEKGCPEDLVEAVSSLIFAASRCGEFPELQELRAIFTSRFGREFAARAIELRNNCGVNPKVIQKMSTKMPSLENKTKVLRQIAADNNIDLPIEETSLDTSVEIQVSAHEKTDLSSPSGGERKESVQSDEIETGLPVRKYKDVADAAQAAFESAAYAAAAARAAVVLSRSESGDPDHPSTPSLRTRKARFDEELVKDEDVIRTEVEVEKFQPVGNNDLEQNGGGLRRSFSGSSLDSFDEQDKIKQRNAVFDQSDDEEESRRGEFGLKMEKRSEGVEPLNINRRPISVRTRWAQGR